MGTIKFIDLFAGIGGFRYGLERANDFEKTGRRRQTKELSKSGSGDSRSKPDKRQHTFSCVWSNEWDRYASEIYKKHYGECDTRDIKTVKSSEIPDFDLLCAGFPCQSFSIAGKRRGFDDTRGTLFFDIARILKDKRPRLLLLENVKGLLSHDNGRTFKTIISTLVELGYDLQWQVVNSKNFSVPQNRERVFIIGHLRGTPRPKVFPIRESNEEHSRKSERQRIAGVLSSRSASGQNRRGNYIQYGSSQDQKLSGELAQTLNAGHYNQPKISLIHNVYGGFKEGVREFKDYSPTIRTPKGGGHLPMVKKGLAIRRLTPIECERLQGFPDDWTRFGLFTKKGRTGFFTEISDTQRYKCIGNAVTTNVITWIGEQILQSK